MLLYKADFRFSSTKRSALIPIVFEQQFLLIKIVARNAKSTWQFGGQLEQLFYQGSLIGAIGTVHPVRLGAQLLEFSTLSRYRLRFTPKPWLKVVTISMSSPGYERVTVELEPVTVEGKPLYA